MSDVWTYRNPEWLEAGDFVGYDVMATDGSIGDVEEMKDEDGHAGIVVETGHWIFDKKRLIPAGSILHVDHGKREIMINLTKEEVLHAPDHHPRVINEHARRSAYTEYFDNVGRVI